jgi:hypothetical protein
MRNTLLKFIIYNLILVFSVLHVSNTCAYEVFADSHIHFNWDQEEETTAQQAVNILKQANIGLTIVSSTPSDMALELREKGGDWIIPFFSPYIHALGKRDWFKKDEVVKQAEKGLKNGQYFGIGEVHFMDGFHPKTDNTIFLQLLQLARKYKVPVLIHIDSSNEITFLNVCLKNPDIKIIFAHAGGVLKPVHIGKILSQCENVWIDFAARDPWRYGGISKEDHTLLPEWKKLVLRFPNRFITGTDPVWKVTRGQTWDQPDEGWQHYQKLLDYHWTWMNDLPEDVRRKISWENTNVLLKK